MKKKIISFLIAVCLFVPCLFMITACGGDDKTAKVMNMGLNPQLEFVLDKDDKVLTVNALNEDGNHIITLSLNADKTKSLFEGMTAEEAMEYFLEITEENGYLITGNEEEIKIEVSGKADKLINRVKEKANNFFTTNGLDISISTDKIDVADIRAKVKECMQEYTDTELNGMTQEQLVDLLKTSRNETKDLLTQELKDAYYAMRVENINMAEIDAIAEKVNELIANTSVYESLESAQKTLLNGYVTAVNNLQASMEAIENAYNTHFLAATSEYNVAKQEYIEAKKALLAKRVELGADGISELEKTILTGLESALNLAETALNTVKGTAELAITTARQLFQSAIEQLNAAYDMTEIKDILNDVPDMDLTELENVKQNIRNGFKAHFENHNTFKDHVGKTNGHWGE